MQGDHQPDELLGRDAHPQVVGRADLLDELGQPPAEHRPLTIESRRRLGIAQRVQGELGRDQMPPPLIGRRVVQQPQYCVQQRARLVRQVGQQRADLLQPAPLYFFHHVLPMSYAIDGVRHLMYGGSGASLGKDLLVLVAWLLAGLTASSLAAGKQRVWPAKKLQPELAL